MKHVRGGYALTMFDITFTSNDWNFQYYDLVHTIILCIKDSQPKDGTLIRWEDNRTKLVIYALLPGTRSVYVKI